MLAARDKQMIFNYFNIEELSPSILCIIIQCKFFFPFTGRKANTWSANNCLQIMVCSCSMLSNCVWLQIIYCPCVKETTLFSPSYLAVALALKWQIASLIFQRAIWDQTIKQLLNSVIAKYSDLLVSRRSIVRRCRACHWQITTFCSTTSNNC